MARRHLPHLRRDELLKPSGERRWPLVGCTALLTAAVALPAGIWIARATMSVPANEPDPVSRSTSSPSGAVGRNPYSAEILNDPYVIDRQLAVVEAMERDCARFGNGCAEARAARAYIDRRAAAE